MVFQVVIPPNYSVPKRPYSINLLESTVKSIQNALEYTKSDMSRSVKRPPMASQVAPAAPAPEERATGWLGRALGLVPAAEALAVGRAGPPGRVPPGQEFRGEFLKCIETFQHTRTIP